MKPTIKDMSNLQVFINAIVVALMAMYVYKNEGIMEKMSTKHDQTENELDVLKMVAKSKEDQIEKLNQLLSTKAETKKLTEIENQQIAGATKLFTNVENQLNAETRKVENQLLKSNEKVFALERKLVAEIKDLKQLLSTKAEKKEHIGTTYIQWGRTNCTADDTETVYSGFVGGSAYTNSGAAVDHLCLINDPQWGIYDTKVLNSLPFIGGALYDVWDINVPNSPFDFNKYDHHRVPCSVCMKKKKTSTIMIPARKDCYGNWVKEYDGYLYAGHPSHAAASEYICLDKTPEALDKSPNWTDKKLLYPVRVNCNGAIPCPPYVNGREVTCVVCSH